MKVHAFVPATIRNRDREKPWMDWIDGTTLFADISGFTPLTEAFSALGAEGSESLSGIINRYFAEMIGIVHAHGGEVMKFGGDSMLCFIQGENSLIRTLHAAIRMQYAMSRFRQVRAAGRRIALQMKIGIASGSVMIAGVGDPAIRCDYIFAGEPVDSSAHAERFASSGEIICSTPESGLPDFETQQVSKGFLKVTHSRSIDLPPLHIVEPAPEHPEQGLRPYLIPEVHDLVSAGYDRYVGALQTVVGSFLRFTGFLYTRESFDLARFHRFFSEVVARGAECGGRLNGVMMGDKGSSFFLLFGAPARTEEKERLACEWALQVRERVARDFPEVRLGVGMASGRVFAGIVGGGGRFDYSAVGDAVNLAARLTQLAADGTIWVNEAIQEKAGATLVVESAGKKRIKGKSEPTACYILQDRAPLGSLLASQQECVGRSRELAGIQQRMKSAGSGQPGMFVLQAEAGVGKTVLAHSALEVARSNGWKVLFGKSEITLRNQPYAPWINIFRELILSGDSSEASQLRTALQKTDPEFVPYFSWHAALLRIPSSEPSPRADAETRKNLLHHQLSRIFLSHLAGPTALFFDDLHWFDSLSIELLAALLSRVRSEPLLILGATHLEWKKDPFINRSNVEFLDLSELAEPEASTLASSLLQAPLRKDLAEFLYRHTHGNPFFLTQLVEYLRKREMIVQRLGEWTLHRDAALDQAISGEDVIAAQVEHLSMPQKIHLRAAACMGPTFSIPVLRKALGGTFRANAVETLIALGYVETTAADWAVFRSALVQDVLYRSLPMKFRRSMHRKIGTSMEQELGARVEFHPNLANHFRLARMRKKAVEYSISAGDRLFQNLSYPESRTYYLHAYNLLKRSADSLRWDVGVKLADTLLRTGEFRECLAISRSLKSWAARTGRDAWRRHAFLLQAEAQRKLSDFRFLKECLRILEGEPGLPEHIRCRFTYLVGATYLRTGKTALAEPFLRRAANWNEEGDSESTLSALSLLASMAADRSSFEEASAFIDRALALAGQSGSEYQETRIRAQWAGILQDYGHEEQARTYLSDLLVRAEALGDYHLLAAVSIHLGQCETNLSNWTAAREYLHEAARLASVLGVPRERAKSEMFLGIIDFYENNYQAAYGYYRNATKLFEETQDGPELCHAYYNLAEVCEKLGRTEEGLDWCRKGMKAILVQPNPQLESMLRELQTLLQSSQ